MNTDQNELDPAINRQTEKIIGAAFEVSNLLGAGFLEKVYENALVWELRQRGHSVEQQEPTPVVYKGQNVGEYFADLIVDGAVICELKCCDRIGDAQLGQCINYLKATGLKICLLLNFQRSKVEIKRVIRT